MADAADAYRPRYIKLNARDNVAIIVNDFGPPAGTKLEGAKCWGLTNGACTTTFFCSTPRRFT
jgi:hypothetical protein